MLIEQFKAAKKTHSKSDLGLIENALANVQPFIQYKNTEFKKRGLGGA